MTGRRDRGDAVVASVRLFTMRDRVWAVQMQMCRSFLRTVIGSLGSLEAVRTPALLALLSGRHALSSDCPDPLAARLRLPLHIFMPPPASPAAGFWDLLTL